MFQPFAEGDDDDSDSDGDSDSSDASTIENNVNDIAAPYQSFTADPASVQEEENHNDQAGSGGLDADVGSDVEVDGDEDARASVKREDEREGEERQWSEVKEEDG